MCLRACARSPAPTVLVVGPEGAGKSVLLQRLADLARPASCGTSATGRVHPLAPPPTLPTVGTELRRLRPSRRHLPRGLVLREVGGAMQPLWPHFYAEAAAVLFVAEPAAGGPPSPRGAEQSGEQQLCPPGSDGEQQQPKKRRRPASGAAASAEQLAGVLGHPELRGKPLCVLLNKMDEPGALAAGAPAWLRGCLPLECGGLAAAAQQHQQQDQQGRERQTRAQEQQQLPLVTLLAGSALTGEGLAAVTAWLQAPRSCGAAGCGARPTAAAAAASSIEAVKLGTGAQLGSKNAALDPHAAARSMQAIQRLSVQRVLSTRWLRDADLSRSSSGGRTTDWRRLLSLSFAALGVVYGDIGTSPLYVFSTIFTEPPTREDVICGASLVFWTITLIVLVKYVAIILMADDHGEGGTFALYAAISRACGIPAVNATAMPADNIVYTASASAGDGDGGLPAAHGPCCGGARGGAGAALRAHLGRSRAAQRGLLLGALFMVSFVLGDGVLTPAISVISAVGGLQTHAGLSQDATIGITCGILVALFALQSVGTQRVGCAFAPTVLLWFISNTAIAVYNIVTFGGGGVFVALSPHWVVLWFARRGVEGWKGLAGVFLCVTGCEAMAADLGHFSKGSVRLSFGAVAYPALVMTYLGQASWLLRNPDGFATVFYSSIPHPVFWPMFVVAVATAIVASQALITGSFSIVRQAMALGAFPRLRQKHTSAHVPGQVYIAEVNWTLLVLCVAVVAGFRSGTAIGNAYGISINIVMVGTTALFTIYALVAWQCHVAVISAFALPFLAIEGAFLSANLQNVPHGGWFSLTLGVIITSACCIWIHGTAARGAALKREHCSLGDVLTYKPPSGRASAEGDRRGGGGSVGLAARSWQLYRVSSLTPLQRNPGLAIVYSESPFQVPALFRRLADSWGVHEVVVFLTVRQLPLPHVDEAHRLLLAPLEFRGFFRAVARYGYLDAMDQGEEFVEALLDKIAVVAPGAAAGLVPAAPKDVVAVAGDAGDAGKAAEAGEPGQPGGDAAPDAAAASGIVAVTLPGVAPAVRAGGADCVTVTLPGTPPAVGAGAAGRAVYVVQRSVLRVRPASARAAGPDGAPAQPARRLASAAEAALLEYVYLPMYSLTSRFWQASLALPAARLFEVGMVVEL
ncbi:HAK2 [Scenedesmus sp. PABB004]|nr:HAK2 [Scenedesmus sp. PABB004]